MRSDRNIVHGLASSEPSWSKTAVFWFNARTKHHHALVRDLW
ncbi:hypothetical protein Z945_2775 [Sulfitobacter noctilucae]|nr:hypothetical protein Z945_2775 [Sulfitobacter noctilucae]